MQRIFLVSFFLYSFAVTADCIAEPDIQSITAHQKELKAINSVIESFRISIINKDKKRFSQLFYNADIPWLGVFSQPSFESIQRRNPKANKVSSDNYLNFIDWIVSQEAIIEEKLWNISIQTDQYIASVHFDYSFHIGDYKSNWGQEAWHLIKTEQGWKINSVIYTMITNQQPPKKKADK